ncbi:hypothetical protein N0V90_006399 [Kalmusia sp. IMI 367209]|nr:hypothetical protein N0V90_006399 [Kalmusia sp. IMI 367209]
MKRTKYHGLAKTHIVRRLLDQWIATEGIAEKWTPPPLYESPAKFKSRSPDGGSSYIYVSGAFIKKVFKVTPEEMEEAGAFCYQKGNAKNKKFALYHVYVRDSGERDVAR